MKRLILEMGTGTDLYGGDYTKAACRAVRDAIGHSSLSLFRSCGYNHRGNGGEGNHRRAKSPAVDIGTVANSLPRGNPQVEVVKGGLNIEDADQDTPTVIAAASVEAFLDIDPADWQIKRV